MYTQEGSHTPASCRGHARTEHERLGGVSSPEGLQLACILRLWLESCVLGVWSRDTLEVSEETENPDEHGVFGKKQMWVVFSLRGDWMMISQRKLWNQDNERRGLLFEHLLLFFFFPGLFRAIPTAYGSSQVRGQIRVGATGLRHSHSNAISEPHLWPTLQLAVTPDP